MCISYQSPRDLVKMQVLTSVGLGRGLRLCITNKLPGDADALPLISKEPKKIFPCCMSSTLSVS